MHAFKRGLITGVILQLAIGPVFFYIVNLTLQKTIYDGLAGVLAVTMVDCFYISLSILGIGRLLEREKIKKVFAVASSIVLAIFGGIIIKGALAENSLSDYQGETFSVLSSFASVFLMTITNPLTIVVYTSLFMARAVEYNYSRKELWRFGLGTGSSTFIFMGCAVVVLSLIKGAVPLWLTQLTNIIVGCLLIGYGLFRLQKILWTNPSTISENQ